MAPKHRTIQEIEVEELRRQVKELQEQLAKYDAAQHNHGNQTEDTPSSEEDNGNPFHYSSSSKNLLQPDDFIDWLCTVERVFELKDIPDDKRVKLVAIKLKKHASVWWENLKRQREREGRRKIKTWDKMRGELKRKFLPEHYRQDTFIKFHKLRQKSLSVEEYTMDFEELLMKCDIQEPEEQTIACYLGGLNTEISDVVQLQPYWTLDDVIRLSLKIEKQKTQRNNTQSPKDKKVILDVQQEVKTEFFKGFGHIAADCPNRRVITLVEEEVNAEPIQEQEEEGEVDYAIEEVPPDCGEALVICRNLNTARVIEDKSWRRHNIFHTRCTVEEKVCKVIIDSGSCENIVSNYMVDKLKLPTELHPHPYKLHWLKKENEVKVTRRCCVQFSMGSKYKDKVWCDVIPMDACHLLLGRPWQYDRRAIHDGFKNTYSFIKDGKKIVLAPLQYVDGQKNQVELCLFTSFKCTRQWNLSPIQYEPFSTQGG
nr:uncharacterized protein LOC112701524 [Arachis hypogaea]